MVTHKIIKKETNEEFILPRMAGKLKEKVIESSLEKKSYGLNPNKYGYQDHIYLYYVNSLSFDEIKKMIEEKRKTPSKQELSDEAKIEKWSKRLAKLTGITLEKAKEIALEKINYKIDRINMMIERQAENNSYLRSKLIAKMERENPLRPIKDEEHARNILIASDRHNNTDYEYKLEEARELIKLGELDNGTAKEYARNNFSKL